MQLLAIGIILIAIYCTLQSIVTQQKHIKEDLLAIEINMRAFILAFNKAVDTTEAFNHLRDATNDESLRSVAMAAALFAQPGTIKAMKIKPTHARKTTH